MKTGKKKIISSKAELFSTIKNYILDPSITGIINAGDADQEGQYLIDEILEYCHNKKPVQRILISNNTLNGVKKALSKIEDNTKYVLLGKSAQARAISDMIVGFSLSRFFSIINKTKLTVGRVQTPTLSLVVNRDLEIENHIKEKYFELFLNTTISSREIKLKHNIKKGTIKEKEILTKLVKNLENTQGDVIISKKESYKTTPFPYNLENLQIVANKIYKYSPQKTLDITQELRDKHKAITYNRSSSSYLSEEHFLEAPTLVPIIAEVMNIKAEFKFEDKPECIKDSEAKIHHGIIPTGVGKIEDLTLSVLEDVKKIISGTHKTVLADAIKKEENDIGVCPKCGGKIFESEKNFYCNNYKEKNCNFTLWKKTKLFGRDEVNITKAKAKTLLSGKSILVKGLKSKIGKEYNAYLKMEVSDKYVNLAIDKFKK